MISVAVVAVIADSIDNRGNNLLSRRVELGSVLLLNDPATEEDLPSILGDVGLNELMLRRDENEYRFLSPSKLCFAGEMSGDAFADLPICCSWMDLGPKSDVSSMLELFSTLDTNVEEATALVFVLLVETSVLFEALPFEFDLSLDEIPNKG